MSVQWVWLFVMTMQTVWILRVVMSVCVELDTLELEATAQVLLKGVLHIHNVYNIA